MGKIAYRRVAPDWVHPTDADGRHIPLFDGTKLLAEQAHWDECAVRWAQGEVFGYLGVGIDDKTIHDWSPKTPHDLDMTMEHYYGDRPNPAYYSPAWTPEQATAWQVYEEVSEGTPISKVWMDLDTMAREIAEEHGHSYEAMRKKILATLEHGWWYVMPPEFEPGGKYGSMTFQEV